MKKSGMLLVAGLMVLCFMGNAGACTTYPSHIFQSDVYEADKWMSSFGGPDKDIFTLTLNNFIPGEQSHLSSAKLVLKFKDDSDLFKFSRFERHGGGPRHGMIGKNHGRFFDFDEFASLSFDKKTRFFEVDNGALIIPIFGSSLYSLSMNGQITFTLKSLFGDFYFKSAELIAKGISDSAPIPTPIPSSMWLFFSALVGSGFLFSGKSRQAC
jgi:hypothetical protein